MQVHEREVWMIWRCIATVLLAAMLVLPALASPAAAADWLTRLTTQF